MIPLLALMFAPISIAAEGVEIYPLPAVFISDQAKLDSDFAKALSANGTGTDRGYAIGKFNEIFRKHFSNVAPTIDSKNKYRTFVAYLQVPRVSKYTVKKSEHLVDLYMPMTITIGFANMVTGEILYTYTYTHYAKYGTTSGAACSQNQEIVKLYRETFDDLLELVISTAKANFNAHAIQATIRDEWKGLYVLDKGTRSGVVKGDTLANDQGQILSILHAEEEFAVGQPLMGTPKGGAIFAKYANEDIAEIKKPKIMLLNDIAIGGEDTASGRKAMVYQLFVNALGKKATFSLLSLDKAFYDVQRAVVETTKLENKVTQQRELPDYFLSLYVQGPFFRSLPTNKSDVSIDEYTVRTCGNFFDSGGQVVYGKCVEEVISDQIVAGIRFHRSAREEIVIKNALIKLADDFIQNVKFTNICLPVSASGNSNVTIEDKPGTLSNGAVITAYHSLGKVSNVNGEVRVPVETLQVSSVAGNRVQAMGLMKFNGNVPAASFGDVVLLQAVQQSGGATAKKKVTFCQQSGNPGFDEEIRRLFFYAVVEGIPYPFYETSILRNTLGSLPEYGFKQWRGTLSDEAEYCIEPVLRIDSKPQDDQTVKCTLVTGIKLYQGKNEVWKKGMQQDWTFSLPASSDSKYLNSEICRVMYPLVTNISKKMEIKP
jgi:hypothetical protein